MGWDITGAREHWLHATQTIQMELLIPVRSAPTRFTGVGSGTQVAVRRGGKYYILVCVCAKWKGKIGNGSAL
jgi:hypothetical protein